MWLGELWKVEQLGFGLWFVAVFDFLMLLLKSIRFGLGNVEGLVAVLFQLKWIVFGGLFCCMLWFLKLL
jgi:hypothetical protein